MNQNIIQISHLSKTYKDGTVALENINLNITDGEIIALLGPNGAGKTTFLSILAGTVIKTNGKVNVLKWDRENSCYYNVKISMYQKGESDV